MLDDAAPSPRYLAAYEKAVPGAADRLLRMAEKDQEHLHLLEERQVGLAKRGQTYALVVALCFLAVAAALVGTGHGVAGTFIGTADILGLATVFIVGRADGRADTGKRELPGATSRDLALGAAMRDRQVVLQALDSTANASAGSNAEPTMVVGPKSSRPAAGGGASSDFTQDDVFKAQVNRADAELRELSDEDRRLWSDLGVPIPPLERDIEGSV